MPATISDIELSMQDGLEALRNAPLSEKITSTLKYLVPDGYRPIVQFEEEGRKKRGSASVDNWNPATGEIVIYFEPLNGKNLAQDHEASLSSPSGEKISRQALEPAPVSIVPARPQATNHVPPPSGQLPTSHDVETLTRAVTDQELTECCQALANAEKSGKHFIALKWFRDDFLPTIQAGWTQSAQSRQLVLTHTIESGKISTKKIPNPKAPQFPTTTITLNRESSIPGVAPRFRPVPVRGEPASETLIRDRGPR